MRGSSEDEADAGGHGASMSAITKFLYPAPAQRSVGGIIKWWERRRLAYNVIVGTAGVVSLGTAFVFAALPPMGAVITPPLLTGVLPGIVIFGTLANVCYLFGPATEVLIQKLWRDQVLPTGPALFRIGLTFSVGLALFPALLMALFWVARVVAGVFGGIG